MNQKILVLDDDVGVLNALKRLFHGEPYSVDVTYSAEEAISFIQKNNYALVISDYRMPTISGVDFLEKAKNISPGAFRILLTGYADIQAAIDAINRSGVYRFLVKPWNNDVLKDTIKQALDHQKLLEENLRLNKITQEQNKELSELNSQLETKVLVRTKEITALNLNLEKSFLNSVKMMSGLLETYSAAMGGHSKRVASIATSIAKSMGITGKDLLSIELAALLHDIGKIGIPEQLLKKNKNTLNKGEEQVIQKHVLQGENLLKNLPGFEDVSKIIRHHHEQFNGFGYPDRLRGSNIPIGARIVAIANAYDNALNNRFTFDSSTAESALKSIIDKCPAHFDPEVVKYLSKSAQEKMNENANNSDEIEISMKDLQPGMILSRSLTAASGRPVLTKGTIIEDKYISLINEFVKSDPLVESIYIYRKQANKAA